MVVVNAFHKISEILKNEALRKGTLFSLFSFFNNGVNFLLLLVLANYILPSDYGYLNLFTTIVMVLGYFKAMSTEGYLSVAFFKEGLSGVRKTFSSIVALSIIFLLIFFFTLLRFGEILSKSLALSSPLLFIAVLIVFFNLYENLFLDYLRIQEKIKYYGIFACVKSVVLFALSITLVKGFILGWQGQVYAQLVCAIVFGCFAFILLVKNIRISKFNWSYCKLMLCWGVPLIPHLSTNFIRQGLDRYIINSSHGMDSVGLFSLALNLTNVIFMVGVGFNQSNSVEIFKLLGNPNISKHEKIGRLKVQRRFLLKVLLVASVAFSLVCYCAVPLILPKYADALKYFPILAVYAFLYCCYFLYTNYLFFFKKTKNIMYVTFGSSILHLCLSFILTKYSLYYTCAIYCVSQGVILLVIRYLALKTLNESAQNEKCFFKDTSLKTL